MEGKVPVTEAERAEGWGGFKRPEKAQCLHSAETQRELLDLRGEIRWVPALLGL